MNPNKPGSNKYGEPNWPRGAAQAMADNEADAAKWRALMSSGRLHFMGCAGFSLTPTIPGAERDMQTLVATPKGNAQLHFGMEFWSTHSATAEKNPDGSPRWPDTFERKFMDVYVDELMVRAGLYAFRFRR